MLSALISRLDVSQVGFSSLRWNAKAQRYHFPAGEEGAGRFLTDKAVRVTIDADIETQAQRMLEIGETLKIAGKRYEAGEIGKKEYSAAVAQWREEMSHAKKNVELNYAAAARGGFHNMTAEHFGRVGGRLRFHFKKLDSFALELFENPALLRDDVPGKLPFDTRVSLYASTGLFTFERERVVSHKTAGFKMYENVPHSSESCHSHKGKVGCTEITAKGKVPIDSEPDVGKRACGPLDKCSWRFSK
jgi:hypothetical protein